MNTVPAWVVCNLALVAAVTAISGAACSSSKSSNSSSGGQTSSSGSTSVTSGGATSVTSGGATSTTSGGATSTSGGSGTSGATGTSGASATSGGATSAGGSSASGAGGVSSTQGGAPAGGVSAGGVGAGGGATAGAGGGANPTVCSHTAPPNATITDFTAFDGTTWGDATSLTGTIFSYKDANSTLTATVDTTAHNLHIVGNIAVGGYGGFGLAFGPCTNASAYSGISFNLTNNMDTGADGGIANTQVASIAVQLQTNADKAVETTGTTTRGACTAASCKSPATTVSLATPGPYTVTFASFMAGAPVVTADSNELWGIQWQVGGGAGMIDLVLDDVKFVP